jgi:hypothetical protein
VTGYQHLAVRAAHDRVAAALAEGVAGCPSGAAAHVGPTEDRWCGLVPPGAADADALAAALSDRLGVPVLWARVDAAALDVRLYVYGEEIVAYRSPETANPAAGLAAAGAVERLIDATAARALPGDLARVLVAEYPAPAARYADLVTVLGLPDYLVGAGEGGEPPAGFVAVTGG